MDNPTNKVIKQWKWGGILVEGFSNQPQKGFSQVEPDAGVPFRRQTFTDIQDIATCRFTLDRETYLEFMSWYKYDIEQGTIPFIIHDCRYNIDRIARIVGDVPNYTTNSKYYDLNITIAFDSGYMYYDSCLVVNEDDPLIVNENDKITVARKLRI